MILSYRHSFIFLHARKTAGTSMSIELARRLGDDDVMVGCWADAIRSGVRPNRAAVRAAGERWPTRRIDRLRGRVDRLRGRGPRNPDAFNQAVKSYYTKHHDLDAAAHSSAERVRGLAGDLWLRAFKFAFVRNPWDHAVSDYYWRRGPQREVPFEEFLERLADPSRPDPEGVVPPIRSNWSVYTLGDEIAVDFVGRYEYIDRDLERISEKLGFVLDIASTHAKSGARDKRDLRQFYNDHSIGLVADIYAPEIAAFEYTIPF